jgi:hypothetical protein
LFLGHFPATRTGQQHRLVRTAGGIGRRQKNWPVLSERIW